MGMGTGGVPTTDNITETTDILSVGHPNISVVSSILSVVGIHTHTRGNSVAHVWLIRGVKINKLANLKIYYLILNSN
jgi:hypothetical protein